MYNFFSWRLLPSIVLLFSAPALAQDLTLPAGLEETIVTTPLRHPSALNAATRPVYVVTRQELETQGALTVAEALKYLPGIRAEGTAGGQVGATSSQSIRGGNSRQVLILLDGRPLNDLGYFGGFDLSEFTTDGLEQIEVLPGGASTLYGADAVGGVINLISRKPTTKQQLTLNAGVGSFGLNSQGLRSQGTAGAFNWSAGYQRLQLENNFPYTTQPTTYQGPNQFGNSPAPYSGVRSHAAVTENNYDAHLDWQLDSQNRLGLSLVWLDKSIQIPGGIPITTDGLGTPNFDSAGGFNSLSETNRQYTSSVLSQLTWTSELGQGEDSTLTARVYGDFLKYRFFSQSFGDTRDDVDRNSYGVQLQHTWEISHIQTLTYGGDYRTVSARNQTADFLSGVTALNYDASYSQGALFAQDEIRWTPEFLTILGLRQDLNSNTTGQLNPSLGVRWRLGETTVRGNYSRSFRAPDLFDSAFSSLNFGVLPNPNLRPERADSYDIGFDQTMGTAAVLHFTYYTNSVNDLQQFVFDPVTFLGQVVNVGLTRAQGTETSLEVAILPNLSLGASYTTVATKILQDSGGSTVGNVLAFQPDVWGVHLSYDHQGWYGGLFLRQVGSFFTSNSNQETLPGYTTLDVKFRWPIADGLALSVNVNNLFDQRYEVYPGYPGLGLDTRSELRWNF